MSTKPDDWPWKSILRRFECCAIISAALCWIFSVLMKEFERYKWLDHLPNAFLMFALGLFYSMKNHWSWFIMVVSDVVSLLINLFKTEIVNTIISFLTSSIAIKTLELVLHSFYFSFLSYNLQNLRDFQIRKEIGRVY